MTAAVLIAIIRVVIRLNVRVVIRLLIVSHTVTIVYLRDTVSGAYQQEVVLLAALYVYVFAVEQCVCINHG